MRFAWLAVSVLASVAAASVVACSSSSPEVDGKENEALGSKCPQIVLKVCGIPPNAAYGQTYLNSCYAEHAGAMQITLGACPTYGESCDPATRLCVENETCVCVGDAGPGCPSFVCE